MQEMAFAVLFSLAQTIDQILNDGRYPVSADGKQLLVSIRNQVISLQESLEKFPKEAANLERRIRDAADQVEDTIEHFMYEQTRSRFKLARSGPATANSAVFLYDFHELKKVMAEIDLISREVMAIETEDGRVSDSGDYPAVRSSSTVSSSTGDSIVVGLDDDLINIKEMLCGESSKLELIPITGMGGIGKTTLARISYDDQLIRERFEIRSWVTVSQDYKIQNVLSNLLDSMKNFNSERSGQRSGQSDESIMKESLYKILKGRRYLIVLDDIWSTKFWDDVMHIFPNDNNGSRIILTTRLADVASYAYTSSTVYKMSFMEVDQSWKLLKQKVFAHQGCPPQLENIGKDIATSCRGLPLAIVLIAGVLSAVSKTQDSWNEIAKNVHSAFDAEDGQFQKIISLSYSHCLII